MRPEHPGPAALAAVAFGLVAVLHLLAQAAGLEPLRSVTLTALVPLLAATVLARTRAPRGPTVRLLLVALGLSWLGDVPWPLGREPALAVKMGFFALAHLGYGLAFWPWRQEGVLGRRRWLLLPYLAVAVAIVLLCAPGAGALLVPVAGYALCLVAMAVLATGVHRLTGLGAVLFLCSDAVLALDAFGPGLGLPGVGVVVMLPYLAAQVLIAAGVLRRLRAPAPPAPPPGPTPRSARPGAGPARPGR